jgi:starch synthase
MKVLFTSSEAHPLAKTGGLADVSGALPAAMRRIGADVRMLLPGYPSVLDRAERLQRIFHIDLPVHGETALLRGTMPGSGVPLYIIEHSAYYAREGLYQDPSGEDWPDNALRFGLLSQFAAWLAGPQTPLDFHPEVLHCNDWQTGMAPAYLHFGKLPRTPSVFTLHNLAYQGIFPPSRLAELGLPPESLSIHGVEYFGKLSFLKAGLFYASRLTTVSPTYAREIQTETFGMGMQGLLSSRKEVLRGILNGIDTMEWNPATDRHLDAVYSAENLAGKALDKLSLQEELGLERNPHSPLLGMVSRITQQKGSDVVIETAPRLIELGAQLAVLGSGEAELEAAMRQLAVAYPGKIAVRIGYDEGLSHRVEAGSDLFLMPSRFEPCGLNQMYSLRYGTPPVVHKVGGLADTVIHASLGNLSQGVATGFVIDTLDADTLFDTIRRAIILYKHKLAWRQLVRTGMHQDFSWENSAREYLAVYRSMMGPATH